MQVSCPHMPSQRTKSQVCYIAFQIYSMSTQTYYMINSCFNIYTNSSIRYTVLLCDFKHTISLGSFFTVIFPLNLHKMKFQLASSTRVTRVTADCKDLQVNF